MILTLRDFRAETAYNLLPHTVAFLYENGNLETVVTEDIRIEAIKESIISSFSCKLGEEWVFDGDRTWSRIHPAS